MMKNREYENMMEVTNEKDYLFWIEFFRTDASIEKFEKVNTSDYNGFSVEFYWNYAK